MPCHIAEHHHSWPDKGELIIEKCERYCGYCEDEFADHEWRFAWFLRRHVRTIHCKAGGDHPDVFVPNTWTGMPTRTQPRLPARRTERKRMSTGTAAKVTKEPRTPSPSKSRRARNSQSPKKHTATNLDSINSNSLTEKMDRTNIPYTTTAIATTIPTPMPTPMPDPMPTPIGSVSGKSIFIMQAFVTAVRDIGAQGKAAGLSARELQLIMTVEGKRMVEEEDMEFFLQNECLVETSEHGSSQEREMGSSQYGMMDNEDLNDEDWAEVI